MNARFKTKIAEIVIDKLLSALIVLLIGIYVNYYIDQRKFSELQRADDVTEFVKACREIWSKVYEYETAISEIESLQASRHLYISLRENDLASEDKLIAAKLAYSNKIFNDYQSVVDSRKFIIGDELALHFAKYISYVNARMAINSRPSDDEYANEALKVYNERIIAMRFDSYDARAMASSRILK